MEIEVDGDNFGLGNKGSKAPSPEVLQAGSAKNSDGSHNTFGLK